MYTDAAICIIMMSAAFSLQSRASVIVLIQNLTIFCLVYIYWLNSSFWHVDFLPSFHLSLALVNVLFLLALYATPSYHLLKISGALLVLLNVSVFFYIDFMGGSSSGLAVVAYPFVRLLIIAAQFVGMLNNGDGNSRKRRKLRSGRGTAGIRIANYQLSFAKIYK